MKNKKIQAGFTLIELLAVMIILVVVGTIIASILVSTLRSGNKSTTTNDIRQNGNYAITQMSKMIAYAESFDGVSLNGVSNFVNCVPPVVGQNTPIPAPSQYSGVKITSWDGGQTIFSCLNNMLSSNSAAMVNSDIDATCYFTCSQISKDISPTIGIDLVLKRLPSSGTLFPEAQTTIHFQTSVTLRNNTSDISP